MSDREREKRDENTDISNSDLPTNSFPESQKSREKNQAHVLAS